MRLPKISFTKIKRQSKREILKRDEIFKKAKSNILFINNKKTNKILSIKKFIFKRFITKRNKLAQTRKIIP